MPNCRCGWLGFSNLPVIRRFTPKTYPLQNATPDAEINDISIQQERIVVTKDTDFFDSFLIRQQPYKLLLVSTGNITNAELEVL